MKKNGFSLVELLAVIVVLGIISSITVISYTGLNKRIDKDYYKNVEQSLLMAGADYFYYNRISSGEVSVKDLLEKDYIDKEVLSSDGTSCDFSKSYVASYKEKTDKTNYYVCLVCDNYKTDNSNCHS